MANQLDGDTICTGTFAPAKFNCPAGAINDASIIAGALIQSNKLISQSAARYAQPPGTAIAAATQLLHTVHGTAATVIAMDVVTPTPPSGDHTVTIDLQKGNAATAFASILSAPLVLNSSTLARVANEASIAAASLVDDDTLQIVVTTAGTTGSQAEGLLVTVTVQELPT